jgi:hypothetical protein
VSKNIRTHAMGFFGDEHFSKQKKEGFEIFLPFFKEK